MHIITLFLYAYNYTVFICTYNYTVFICAYNYTIFIIKLTNFNKRINDKAHEYEVVSGSHRITCCERYGLDSYPFCIIIQNLENKKKAIPYEDLWMIAKDMNS